MDNKIKKIINHYNKKNLGLNSIDFKKLNFYKELNKYFYKKNNKIHPLIISKHKLKINEMYYG